MPKYIDEGTASKRSWLFAIVEMLIAFAVLIAVLMNRAIETSVLQAIERDTVAYLFLATLYTFCGGFLLYYWSMMITQRNSSGKITMIVWALASFGLSAWYFIQAAIAH